MLVDDWFKEHLLRQNCSSVVPGYWEPTTYTMSRGIAYWLAFVPYLCMCVCVCVLVCLCVCPSILLLQGGSSHLSVLTSDRNKRFPLTLFPLRSKPRSHPTLSSRSAPRQPKNSSKCPSSHQLNPITTWHIPHSPSYCMWCVCVCVVSGRMWNELPCQETSRTSGSSTSPLLTPL